MLAIHALTILIKNSDKHITTKKMASILGASENHLAKIMQILVKNRLVDSVKGPSGGFVATIDAEKTNLKNIIELIEGPFEIDFCPFFKNCAFDRCIFGKDIREYSEKIVKTLENKNLKQVAENSVF